MNKQMILAAMVTLMVSCGRNKQEYDAAGSFEAIETIVSAEASGVVKMLKAEEGQELTAGQFVGYIDSLQLYLRKKQVQAQVKALLSRMPDAAAQLAVLQEQMKQAEKEQQRLGNLVKADAASQKQLDDVNTQVQVVKKQYDALQSTLHITSNGLNEETVPLTLQAEQVNDQLRKCRIINPVKGTVLVKYLQENEMAMPGKALYKIADLSEMILRAYISGNQLAALRIGQQVKVMVDSGADSSKVYSGVISWISDKAEFTPKTIQTKDERANLVYAVKIRVKNDGLLKIGMYGELSFQ